MATQKEMGKALKSATAEAKKAKAEIKKMQLRLLKIDKAIDVCESTGQTLPKLTTQKGAQAVKKIGTQTKAWEKLLDELETEGEALHEMLDELREAYEGLEPIG
ncbi:MAG: hypothetical protein AAGK04_02885 [Planctomycetota bacterium]